MGRSVFFGRRQSATEVFFGDGDVDERAIRAGGSFVA